MDWSVTARTTHPHVRQTVADRELETWLAVDLSASLDFGTGMCEKRDLAIAAVAALAHLTTGSGNRIGAVISTGNETARVPARGGRLHAQSLLRTVATTPHAPDGIRGDLQGLVESLRRPQRRRGLAVVVSDFLGPLDWERSLRALSGRHELLAVEIVDRRDLELPDLGDVVLHDPETGRTREFTTTPELRADYAQAAVEHRAAVHQALRSSGAPVLTLRTDRDWIGDVVRFVAARRHSFGAPARQGGR